MAEGHDLQANLAIGVDVGVEPRAPSVGRDTLYVWRLGRVLCPNKEDLEAKSLWGTAGTDLC